MAEIVMWIKGYKGDKTVVDIAFWSDGEVHVTKKDTNEVFTIEPSSENILQLMSGLDVAQFTDNLISSYMRIDDELFKKSLMLTVERFKREYCDS